MKTLAQIVRIKAEPPSLKDNTADIDRIKRSLQSKLGRSIIVPYRRVQKIATRFRAAGFKGYALINDLPATMELVDFYVEKPAILPGLALDLGTTHLEAQLVDMISGKVIAAGNLENSQIKHGADILSRIQFAAKNNGLSILHRQIIDCINTLADKLSEDAGVSTRDIRALCVSGNTTMLHFALNFDPSNICREPYIPTINAPDPCKADDLNLILHPAAPVFAMPNVGSYFGGDLISGIIASGLGRSEKTSMLVDVGTNAEVVIGNNEWMIACAGAAGPALEGGVARMGMRAGPGAIEHVEIDRQSGELHYSTIGDSKPRGICGSGIIDLVANLYLSQIIDLRGKFNVGSSNRLVEKGDEVSFVVASREESANGPVLLGQVDLDALMRSKAAMYSILTTLINQVGMKFEDLHRIYIAGAFGQHIAPRQAIILGMIPDLPLETYEPIGNSSLVGARAILLDAEARLECLELVSKITYVELNVNQEFMMRFSGAKFIPHTDKSLFPTVPTFE